MYLVGSAMQPLTPVMSPVRLLTWPGKLEAAL